MFGYIILSTILIDFSLLEKNHIHSGQAFPTISPQHSPSGAIAETIMISPHYGEEEVVVLSGSDLFKATGSGKLWLEFSQPDFPLRVLPIASCINMSLIQPWNIEPVSKYLSN